MLVKEGGSMQVKETLLSGSMLVMVYIYPYNPVLVSDTFLVEATNRLSDTFLDDATGIYFCRFSNLQLLVIH